MILAVGYRVNSKRGVIFRRWANSILKQYLLKRIPNYMIPSYFVQLEKMPCTINGKIDRKNLPQQENKL